MANRDLTVGSPGRIIRSYCLPLFGSVFFQQMYNLADSFVAGRFIGENALAAVGNSYELTLIFIALATGCNTGCSITTARYFGAKDYAKVRTAITTSLIATAVVWAALTLFGVFGSAHMLRAINTPEAIFDDSLIYIRIYVGGLAFMYFYNVATGIFSALGDSKTPFYFLAISSTANVILDIVFVTVFNMGVAGVGWATLICQGAACISAMLTVMRKVRKLPEFEGDAPFITRNMLNEFISVAAPSTLQQVFVAAGNIIIQGVVNAYGAAVTAGYCAAVKMNNLVTACFSTIGGGVSNYTSQNLGADRPERVRQGFRESVKLTWLIALVMCLLYELFPAQLVNLFLNDSSSAETLQTGIDFLRIAAPFYFAPALKIMCDSILCGAKKMNYVVFSIFLDLGLRASIAAACSAAFGTAFSVWFAWPIGWVSAAVITCFLYQNGLKTIYGAIGGNDAVKAVKCD